MRGKLIALLLLQTALAIALILAGRYTALAGMSQDIAAFREADTLATMPATEMRPGDEKVYFDDAANSGKLLSYCWTAPHVMTPFVGHGPEPGQSSNAHTNLWQCRSAAPIRTPKPEGVIRIFTTGGSTLWGSGASSDARTISGYLEAMLNAQATDGRQYEVFALANPSWASTHERIVIENRISEWEPDLVISLSGLNDVHWGFLGRNVLWFRAHADQLFFDLLNGLIERTGHPPMRDVAMLERAPVPAETVAYRLTKNARLATLSLTPLRTPYVFCLQPILPTSGKPLSPREQEDRDEIDPAAQAHFEACYGRLRERLESLDVDGFHFADLSGTFDGLGSTDEIFLDPYHFGDRGNKHIAERIAAAIEPLLERMR